MSPTLLFTSDLTQNHLSLVGEPAMALNRLMHLRIPTLPGFIITPQTGFYYQSQGSLSQDRLDEIYQAYAHFSPELNSSLLLTSINSAQDVSIPTYDLANSDTTLIDSLYRLWSTHPGAAILVQPVPDIRHSGIILYLTSPSGSRQAHIYVHRGFWHPTEINRAHKITFNLQSNQIANHETRSSSYFSQIQGARLVTRQTEDVHFLDSNDTDNLTAMATLLDQHAHEFNFAHFLVSDNQVLVQSLEQARFTDMLNLDQLYKKKSLQPIARGLALSHGQVSGPIEYLSPGQTIHQGFSDAIVIASKINISQFQALPKAIIVEKSPYSSPVAVFARHHHIPALSVDQIGQFSYLMSGQTVVLNTFLSSLSLPQDSQIDTNNITKTKTQLIIQSPSLSFEPNSHGTFLHLNTFWSSLMGLTISQVKSHPKSIQSRLSELLVSQAFMQPTKPLILSPSYPAHEFVEQELLAIKAARKHASNIHLVLPMVSTLEQLKATKKQLYFYGLKRSASFKFYLHLNSPLTLYHLAQLAADGLDGVVIDIDSLLANLSAGNFVPSEDPDFLNLIQNSLTQVIQDLRLDCYLAGDTVIYDPDLLQKMIKLHVTGVIVMPDRVSSISQDIARNEINISKNKHRLNKRKRQP